MGELIKFCFNGGAIWTKDEEKYRLSKYFYIYRKTDELSTTTI